MTILQLIVEFFLKKNIRDSYFGKLLYREYNYPGIERISFLSGEVFFKPFNAKVSIIFHTDKKGPKSYQKELFKVVEEKYENLLDEIQVELDGTKYNAVFKEKKLEGIVLRDDYELDVISIGKKVEDVFSWDFTYKTKSGKHHEIAVFFKNFEITDITVENW